MKKITVNQLHKRLTKLIEQGHKRKYVMINKDSFKHPLEPDGCVILPVHDCEVCLFPIMNDDGGWVDDNGQEKYKTSLILSGGN